MYILAGDVTGPDKEYQDKWFSYCSTLNYAVGNLWKHLSELMLTHNIDFRVK